MKSFLKDSQHCFATLEEEDDHYYQKIQKFYEAKRELFAREDAFATVNAIKKRECLLIEKDNKKKMRKMPKKMNGGPMVIDDATVQLKRFITGEMYGLHMKLVIQKMLYESDMKKELNRLNMPIKQLETQPHEFLTDDEIRMIDESDGIEVRVVGPTLQTYEQPMWLKKWHMKQTDNYVLKTNWNNFVAANEALKRDAVIQVWSFRKDRKLCFAIVPVERSNVVNDVA